MEIGKIVKAKVQKIENFGIFFNYQGKEILVTIPEISWDRISHPSDFTEIGQDHDVLILRIESGKIAGSIKQTNPDGNPWKDPSILSAGTKHTATVISNFRYGTFLQIPNGPEALLKKENGGGDMEIETTQNVKVIYSEPPYKLEVKKETMS